jgi:hypothetical protein
MHCETGWILQAHGELLSKTYQHYAGYDTRELSNTDRFKTHATSNQARNRASHQEKCSAYVGYRTDIHTSAGKLRQPFAAIA